MISGQKLLYNLENLVERKPITADIFLNDYCNNKCPYCSYARYGKNNRQWMGFEDFVTYAEILKGLGVKGFILTGGGEPTISKDFDKITAWLESQGLAYGINTNFNVLKYIKPTFLKVSLDGWDEDSYQAKRGVRKYTKVVDNIEKYLDWKAENNVSTSVGIQTVVMSAEDALRFYEANKHLDIDYMNFRPVESTGGSYYKDKDISDIIKTMEDLNKKDSRVTVNYKWYKVGTKFEKCFAHCTQIALNQRGEVIFCCHKPYEVVGHITDVDIMDKLRKAETNIKMCDVPCRLTGPNELVKDIEKGCRDSGFI